MWHRVLQVILISVAVVAFPFRLPAPLVYSPEEGWRYEPVGEGEDWRRDRADEQLEVAQAALDAERYKTAVKAAQRVVNRWPLSDYTAQARYLLGRAREARNRDEKAFESYQELVDNHPNFDRYPEVLERQYQIAHRFLEGQKFRLWNTIRLYRSMKKTAELFEQVVENGPHSEIGAQAQLKQAEAWEKASKYSEAVEAYEKAVDRYHNRPEVASDALFRLGLAYYQQALEAEYDQSLAGKAIDTFNDFAALFPDDPRVPEAEEKVAELEREQARGSFSIARFYEKRHEWDGALIYYNEVLQKAPASDYADRAKQRMDEIKRRRSGDQGQQAS